MNVIKTESLTKKYGSKIIIDNININVEAGEIFGFLGPNGAGKTTLINILTGIIHPTLGTFEILGKKQESINKIKNKIGVLPDYISFYQNLTPIQHLEYFSKIMKTNLKKEDLYVLLEHVGLKEAMNKKLKKFSFGMKKKLGVAQALINNPELIFLDEPTSGVDMNSALEIHNLITDFHKKGKTVFMTSHNLNEIEKLCTSIGIIQNGTINYIGTIKQLKKKYQNSFNVIINHSNIRNKNELIKIKSMLEEVVNKFKFINDNSIICNVNDKEIIPMILRKLIEFELDIYQVHIREPSLEEIFLKFK